MTLLLATFAEPEHFSLAEKLLFAAMAAASAFIFGRRFAAVLGKIFKSKKDPSFHLFPIGPRIRDFVWEVLCRPKSSAATACGPRPCLCLLGIPRLRLGHAESLCSGFRAWLSRSCRRPRAFLLLVCRGLCAGLRSRHLRALRAPIFHPTQMARAASLLGIRLHCPADLCPDGHLPGLLLRLRCGTPRGSSGGCTRSPCSLSCPSFLTQSTCICCSARLQSFSRAAASPIPPLAGDEDFGLVAGTDLTQLVSLQAYSCVECGRCTEHCPAANTGKLLNPKEIILGLRDYLNELGPQSDQPLLGKYNSQEAAFQCTTCGACEFQCPVGIEHVPILIGLRRGAVNTGEVAGRSRLQTFSRAGARVKRVGHQPHRA